MDKLGGCANEREYAAVLKAFTHIMNGVLAAQQAHRNPEGPLDAGTIGLVFDAVTTIAETALSCMELDAHPSAIEDARKWTHYVAHPLVNVIRLTATIDGPQKAWDEFRASLVKMADHIIMGDGIKDFGNAAAGGAHFGGEE